MTFRALVPTLIALTLWAHPSQAQQTTAQSVQDLLFTRCDAAVAEGQADISEGVATSDGLEISFATVQADGACQVFVQSNVGVAVKALTDRFSADQDWSLAGDNLWRSQTRMIAIKSFDEDGVPGASIVSVPVAGKWGLQMLEAADRARRPLVDVALRAAAVVCPALDLNNETARVAVLKAEPELASRRLAADASQGSIRLHPMGDGDCQILLAGPQARTAARAVLADAEARGYRENDGGVMLKGDRAIAVAESEDEDQPGFIILVVPTALLGDRAQFSAP